MPENMALTDWQDKQGWKYLGHGGANTCESTVGNTSGTVEHAWMSKQKAAREKTVGAPTIACSLYVVCTCSVFEVY